MIDICVNLANEQFNHDRDAVVSSAWAAGISHLILTGTSLSSSIANSVYANRDARLSFTAGVHPHSSGKTSITELDKIKMLAFHDKCVAIGETGLDYVHEYSNRAEQQKWFESLIYMSHETSKPLFLHERGAHLDFISTLKNQNVNHGVVHCFTGTVDEARAYLDMGLYLGITGWVTDQKRNQHLLSALEYIPVDRILVETDAPYLTPKIGNLPRRNEPKFLHAIVSFLANYYRLTDEQFKTQIILNSKQLLGV